MYLFFVFLSISTPQITILYPQGPFRYSPKSVSVRSGPFRYQESPFRYSESPFRYPRKSVSVRSGPFRSVPVNRDTAKIVENNSGKKQSNYIWSLGDTQIHSSEETTHLGLKRTESGECEVNVNDRIKSARRTKYSLMNSGYHGTNGLSPATSFQSYKTYVLPRLLYRLEILPLNKTHIASLEKFHRNSLRIIQSLPERTATAAVYLLLGALPVEAEIHQKQLSLLHSILDSDNRRIKEVLHRQITVNFDNKDSFFYRILKVLELYELPDIASLKQQLPTKTVWKDSVLRSVTAYWRESLVRDAHSKTTLKSLTYEKILLGEVHPVWASTENSVIDVRKAIVKARILTGTCLLQANIHSFSQYREDPTCRLCKQQEEDIFHMLLYCPLLSETRIHEYKVLIDIVINHIGAEAWKVYFSRKEDITQLIIDSRRFSNLPGDTDIIYKIEKLSRNLCYKLHNKRLSLLRKMEDDCPGGNT